MDDSFDLSGRRILITGAASGMGKAFAELAAADGAHVGLLDLNAAGLDATLAGLGGGGRRVAVPVDLSDWPAAEAAVAMTVREALGGFDAVFSPSLPAATSRAGTARAASGSSRTRCGSGSSP